MLFNKHWEIVQQMKIELDTEVGIYRSINFEEMQILPPTSAYGNTF